MNKLRVLLLVFNAFFAQAQYKNDTLIIGKHTYVLKKCKIFYNTLQNTPVALPSEYFREEREYNLNYKKQADSIFIVTTDPDGNSYTVLAPAPYSCSQNPSTVSKSYAVRAFTDTIRISIKEFCNLKPYIKTNSKRIYFKASRSQVISNDTITEVAHENMVDGDIFSFFQDCYRGKESQLLNKKTVFLVEDFYYTKGLATFYLGRSFLLIIE